MKTTDGFAGQKMPESHMSEHWPRLFVRAAVAALCGVVIAWVLTAVVLHIVFAGGGYTRDALVELPSWAIGLVGGIGAILAVLAVMRARGAALPRSVWMTGVGSLVGAAVAVIPTLLIAYLCDGPTSKNRAPYLEVGLFFVAPIALILGGWGGFLASRWRRVPSEQVSRDAAMGPSPQSNEH